MRRLKKKGASLLALCTALLLLTGGIAVATESMRVSESDQKEIAQLGKKYLQGRADAFVTGGGQRIDATAFAGVRLTPTMQAQLEPELVRAAEARGRSPYAWRKAIVSATVEGTSRLDRQTIKLNVSELTSMTYDLPEGAQTIPPSSGPQSSKYSLNHTLTFVKNDGKWELAKDTLIVAPGTEQTLPAPYASTRAGASTSGVGPKVATGVNAISRKNSLGTLGEHHEISTQSSKFGEISAQAYNYRAMESYAERHWNSYNSAYRTYGNDCTNFTSQILEAGGWSRVGSQVYEYQDNSKWFYNAEPWPSSYSWAGAHNWALFAAVYSGRTYTYPDPNDTQVTDIIQADWEADGTIDHTMFVTKVVMFNGGVFDVLLAYHSNNNYNRSLAELMQQHPGGDFYAHKT